MSNFNVLIFNDEKEKRMVWKIGTDLGMTSEEADMWLNEKGWSVDPFIKAPHLFINAPIISIVEHYYEMGLRTFDEMYTYQEEELQITDEAIKILKNSSHYEQRVKRFLSIYEPLDEKLDGMTDNIEDYAKRQEIYHSKEFTSLEKRLRSLERMVEWMASAPPPPSNLVNENPHELTRLLMSISIRIR